VGLLYLCIMFATVSVICLRLSKYTFLSNKYWKTRMIWSQEMNPVFFNLQQIQVSWVLLPEVEWSR